MTKKDTLYATPQDIAGFQFDTAVAEVFPDMIRRSVPGYSSVVAMSGFLAQRFAQDNTNLYDLGCSLGATTLSMAASIAGAEKNCSIIAVDNSKDMLDQAKQNLTGGTSVDIRYVLADIVDMEFENASLIALNYTLMFVAAEARDALVTQLADATNHNGVLILSEKVAFEDSAVDQLYSDLHHDFKRSNGYSDLEVSQKRTSLENVLVPETIRRHEQRLKSAGFSRVELWFQCLNFASLLAFK